MRTRIVAGVSAAVLLIWLLYWGPLTLINTAVLFCAALAYLEYDRLFFPANREKILRQLRLVTMISLTILAMRRGTAPAFVTFWLTFVFQAVWHVVSSESENDFAKSVRNFAYEIMGYLYIVALFGFVMPIVEAGPRGRDYLMLFFLIVFLGDTVAYFAGSRFGKHRLAPHISPKKSVEGAIAGLLSCFAAAAFWLAVLYRADLSSPFALRIFAVAPLLNLLGQLGDLFESMLKRSATQKDSGSFLPGHGGILDRIDCFLLAAPVFYFFLTYFLEAYR